MTELYANSEPTANFLELVQTAKDNNAKDDQGRLIIPFNEYEIDMDKFDSIFNGIVKKYKIKEPYLTSFKMETYLGASPKMK
ncbi:MAG: hypothetical protein ACYC5G_05210 [Candidatus Doudnabacteria bacterium]